MEAYQVRFMNEYDELVLRYTEIITIIKNFEEGTLDFTLKCPIELLKEQADVLWRYIEILWERSEYENVDLNPVTNGVCYAN